VLSHCFAASDYMELSNVTSTETPAQQSTS